MLWTIVTGEVETCHLVFDIVSPGRHYHMTLLVFWFLGDLHDVKCACQMS